MAFVAHDYGFAGSDRIQEVTTTLQVLNLGARLAPCATGRKLVSISFDIRFHEMLMSGRKVGGSLRLRETGDDPAMF